MASETPQWSMSGLISVILLKTADTETPYVLLSIPSLPISMVMIVYKYVKVKVQLSDLAVVPKEDPAALGIERSKLLEPAQFAVGQGGIQLGVEGAGVVPGRPANRTAC